MHRDGLERHKDSISGNLDNPTWPVIGREPTNQTIGGRRAFTYFDVFPREEMERMEAELNRLAGFDREGRSTSVTAGSRTVIPRRKPTSDITEPPLTARLCHHVY